MKGDRDELAGGERDEVEPRECVEAEHRQDEERHREVSHGDVDEERGARVVQPTAPDHDEDGHGVAQGP